MKLFRTALLAAFATLMFSGFLLAGSLVNLNTASAKELEALKGVGRATAKKIIAARPYHSIDELSKAGLSANQIAAIRSQVTVSAPPAATPAAATATAPKAKATNAAATAAGLIDLNTASEKDLKSLKGIGSATAKRIIAARPYRSVDELAKAGVAAKTIAKIRPLVLVSAPAAAAPVQPSATPRPAPVAAAPAAPPVAAPAAPTPSPSTPATSKSTSATSRKTKLQPGQTVNINTASLEMLEALPGIGPVKAQAIIDGRPYLTPEDVMKVKGIKQGEFAKIKNFIVVK